MPVPAVFDVESVGGVLIVVLPRSLEKIPEEDVKPKLDQLLERLGRPVSRNVVIDFTNVPFFCSSTLQAVVKIWKHLLPGGSRMALCNVSKVGREILRTTKFDSLWPVCSSRSEALKTVTG
jgi:anti-anti-sigma factor